jgi:hypothetical protein
MSKDGERRYEIGKYRNSTLWSVSNEDGLFILLDDLKIAARGHPDTPQADIWVTLVPGWKVTSALGGDEIWVQYTEPEVDADVIKFPGGRK